MRITCDEKLIGHIFNHAYLRGSVDLEGNLFRNTIGYMSEYINGLAEKGERISEPMQRIIRAWDSLRRYEEITDNPATTTTSLNSAATNILGDILRLQDNDFVLIPGGWVDSHGGHALVYQYHKDSQGDVYFSVHNSGSGLEHHAKRSSQAKELYWPVLTYKIPSGLIHSPYFQQIIYLMLEAQVPRIHKKTDIGPDYLYRLIFTSFSYIEGVLVDSPGDIESAFTAAQLSGVCAQHALHALLKSCFATQDEYRTFIYHFKNHALADYWSIMTKDGAILKPRHHGQLIKAIRHQLRLLILKSTKDPSRYLFDEDIKSAHTERLSGYLSQLQQIARGSIPPARSPVAIRPTSAQSGHFFRPERIAQADAIEYIQEIPEHIRLFAQNNDLLAQMDRLIEYCAQLSAQNKNHALFEQLEHFILHMPLPEASKRDGLLAALLPYYQSIDTLEKAFLFYQKMNCLQKYYFTSADAILGKKTILPRMLLVKLSITAVTIHINNNKRLNEEESFHFYHLLSHLDEIIYQSGNAPYMSTNSPVLDQHYQNIHHLIYKARAYGHWNASTIAYYQSIINTESNLKRELEETYVSERARGAITVDEPLHRLLCAERRQHTSLYYLITHQDRLQTEQFTPLISKLKHQKEMEELITLFTERFTMTTSSIRPIESIDLPAVIKPIDPIIEYFRDSNTLKLKCTLNSIQPLTLRSNLLNNKYGVRATPSDTALLSDIKKYAMFNENKHQLTPWQWAIAERDRSESAAKSINQEDFGYREFFHLRHAPESQIYLTLDYFNRHPDKLKQQEIQVYVEANLFQPGLLLRLLSDSPQADQFFTKLHAFINNGLAYHQKNGLLSQHSLFYIRMRYLLTQYAYQYDLPRFQPHMTQLYKDLNRQLAIQTDLSIKTVLHRYRFLCTITSTTHTAPTEEQLRNTLISGFHVNAIAHSKHHLDSDSLFQYQCAQYQWRRLLQHHRPNIDMALIIEILKNLNITPDRADELEITGEYPRFMVRLENEVLYVLHADQCLVFKENLAFHPTPLNILKHPIIKQLGLDTQYGSFISADGLITLIENATHTLRFIKSGARYRIQKKWADARGTVSWYELQALSAAQATYWELIEHNTDAHETLSKVLTERDALAWVCLDDADSFVISNGQNERLYQGIQNRIRHEERILCNGNTWMHQRLHRSFEDTRFIDVWAHEGAYQIDLKRYGLHLRAGHTDTSIRMMCEDEEYTLLDGATIFQSTVPHLIGQNNTQALCILPIQRFINTQERSAHNEYYELTLDTNHTIATHIINTKLTSERPQCWQYSQSERFFIYKMKEGQALPQSPEEALYLCYIYLGTHEELKAWAVLEDCNKRLGGLSGTYEELEILSWIIQSLPYVINIMDPKAAISSPPYVACQLKALSLLTQFARSDKEIPFPRPTSPSSSVNALLEEERIKTTRSFYQTLPSAIYTLIARLQPMRRELPADYVLTDSELKSLLDFYHQTQQKDKEEDCVPALGALGYEWVQLQFRILRKEYTHLQAKDDRQALTPYETRRKKEIETFIAQHEGVRARTSKLEYRPVDLSIPANVSINPSTLRDELRYEIYWYSAQEFKNKSDATRQESAITALKVNMPENEFFRHLFDYIHIIIDADHPRRAALLHFCKATLITCRHIPLSNCPTDLPLLCNMLYRIQNATQEDIAPLFSISELLKHSKSIENLPAIVIPQLVDDRSEFLCSADELWSRIEPIEEPIPPKIPQQLVIQDWFDEELKELRTQWHAIEQAFQSGKSGDEVEPSSDERAFATLTREEVSAGFVKYTALQKWKRLAIECMGSKEQRGRIEIFCKRALRSLLASQEQLKTDIMALASEGSEAPLLQQERAIDQLSRKEKALEFTDLLNLYFHNDSLQYATKTGLSQEKINQLHALLTAFVAQGIQAQQCERIISQLEQIKHLPTEERPCALFALGKILCAQNHVDVVREPALSLFQYYSNIRLHPQQEEALRRLLGTQSDEQYPEVIEKIIMGGGKSKVILPTLAQKKARGTNLVIIEVPKALLRTNFVDLKASSSMLFHQEAVLFEFNRDSTCSAQRLEALYDQFTEIMVNKQYIITTGDSLQSLELKYLELLHQQAESAEEKDWAIWHRQVKAAERLVLLVKHRGDVIIDEVHQGLLLKNELNYTLGEPSAIPHDILNHAQALYQFFSQVLFEPNISLYEALIQRKPLAIDVSRHRAMNSLLEALLNHERSPISEEIGHLAAGGEANEIKEHIRNYLSNTGDTIPQCIADADKKTKEKLAFYKEQIAHLLPFTLKRQQGEHYGPSKLSSRSAEERMVARPYVANNVPSERSEFGNYLEAINYTIQSALITGISKDLLKIAINSWIAEARLEDNPNDSPIATQFEEMTRGLGISFTSLDPDNEEQLAHIHQHIGQNSTLIFTLLKSHILPRIKTNSSILRSDAYSHVDLVRSCQGMSGTPSNHTTFHHRLHFAEESSLGTDNFVLRAIQEKRPGIYPVDFTDTESFIHQLMSRYNPIDQIRTIIDINASFKGISNLTVAQALVAYIASHQTQLSNPEPIQYVLFFNEENELTALRIREPLKPIILGSSDPQYICRRLNCKPSAYFTYYDQAHTTGTDIKQSPKSKGLALIDHNTPIQSFLQGSMRLRELLDGNQSIDIIVPTHLGEISFAELSSLMITNEQRQLQEDNFHASSAQMRHLIRADLMQRLLNISGDDAIRRKHQFLLSTEDHFIEHQSTDFWKVYGALTIKQRTSALLEQAKTDLLANWQALMKDAEQALSFEDIGLMEARMNDIISRAKSPGFCVEEHTTRAQSVSREVEVQQQRQVQVEVLKEKQRELYNPELVPVEYTRWGLGEKKLQFKTLQTLCNELGDVLTPEFNANIRASVNFYKSYKDQTRYIGQYLKPVHALLFRRVSTGELQCTLLSQEEYNELHTTWDEYSANSWISTTQDTVLLGTAPEGIEQDQSYRSIIEQIRYFNGEFGLIKAPFYWLAQGTEEKIRFYKTHLWSCHESAAADIAAVAAQCSEIRKIFDLMMKKPWADWSARFSNDEQSPDEMRMVTNLARALEDASRRWKDALDSDSIAREHALDFSTSGYLSRYVKQLALLTRFMQEVCDACDRSKNGVEPFAIKPELYNQVKKDFSALCSSLNRLPNKELDDTNCDYQLIAQIRASIPLCENQLILLSASAYNPNITSNEIEQLLPLLNLNASRNGLLQAEATEHATRHIAYGLLANPSEILSQEQFIYITDSQIEFDKETLLCLAKHRLLSEDKFIDVLRKAGPLKCTSDILTVFISKYPNMSLNILQGLITIQGALTEQHISEILKRNDALGAQILDILCKHQPCDYEIKQAAISREGDENLAHQINSAGASSVIDSAVGNIRTADRFTYWAAVQHPLTSDQALIKFARWTVRVRNNGEFIRCLLNRQDMRNGRYTRAIVPILVDTNQEAIVAYIADTETSIDAIQAVAETISSEALFRAILDRCMGIQEKDKSNQVCHALVQNNAFTNIELIERIIPQADKRIIDEILVSKANALNTNTLRTILGRDDLDEAAYLAIAQHPLLNDADLINQLIARRHSLTVLQKLIQRRGAAVLNANQLIAILDCNDVGDERSVLFDALTEDHCNALIHYPNTAVSLLKKLANKDPLLSAMILEQLFSRDCDAGIAYRTELLESQMSARLTIFRNEIKHIENNNRQQINTYLENIPIRLNQIKSIEELNSLYTKLGHMLASLQSPVVRAIHETVARLEKEKPSFFSSDAKIKAKNIINALNEVPLEEQWQILRGTTPQIKAVQEALAAHRNIFMRLYRYFCKLFQRDDPNLPFPLRGAAKSYIDIDNAALENQRCVAG